ncbi:MAG TPA: hypothetical protein VE959_07760 [Bryobacteraceae bacterium]|nr:hypothetical protein [Bryobacteraceae bacterium]
MTTRLCSTHVFINCPFDSAYKPLFNAIVFAIDNLEFVARCALELDDAGEVRLAKIERLIEECKFGIHDISSVALDTNTGLPRFNMPLELGLFLGCKRFGGGGQRGKACLILDTEPYRYRAFMSDISGQDVHAHGGDPSRAIVEVRNWLTAVSGRKEMPGGEEIARRYTRFLAGLPGICAGLRREPQALTFADLSEIIGMWLKAGL